MGTDHLIRTKVSGPEEPEAIKSPFISSMVIEILVRASFKGFNRVMFKVV